MDTSKTESQFGRRSWTRLEKWNEKIYIYDYEGNSVKISITLPLLRKTFREGYTP